MSDFRTHYAIIWTDADGTRLWARTSRKREAIAGAKSGRGRAYQVNHGSDLAWDCPTFCAVGDCIADFRQTAPAGLQVVA